MEREDSILGKGSDRHWQKYQEPETCVPITVDSVIQLQHEKKQKSNLEISIEKRWGGGGVKSQVKEFGEKRILEQEDNVLKAPY